MSWSIAITLRPAGNDGLSVKRAIKIGSKTQERNKLEKVRVVSCNCEKNRMKRVEECVKLFVIRVLVLQRSLNKKVSSLWREVKAYTYRVRVSLITTCDKQKVSDSRREVNTYIYRVRVLIAIVEQERETVNVIHQEKEAHIFIELGFCWIN